MKFFQERVVRVEKPAGHFTLLRNPTGGISWAYLTPTNFQSLIMLTIRRYGTRLKAAVLIVMSLRISCWKQKLTNSEDGYYLRHNGNLLASDGSTTNEGDVFSAGHGPGTPAF